MSYWGHHLTIDAADCSRTAITDPVILKEWVEALVEAIQMVPYGEPQIVHFGHNEEHLKGWTVIQLIETSNIIAHFCDETGEGYIDIFSCKEYDIEVAKQSVQQFFNPSRMRCNFITRQA